MKRNSNWARIVVSIFTMVSFFASVCATTCSIGFCPEQTRQVAGHDCESGVSHHHSIPSRKTPANNDCSPHQHPGSYLAKSGEFSQFQLKLASQFNVLATTVSNTHQTVLSMADADATDVATPIGPSTPLYQKISVLRI